MSPTIPKPITNEDISKFRLFFRKHYRMPTYQEIADLFGYASKRAAEKLVQKFIKQGLIEKGDQGKLMPKFSLLSVPLVGYVQAGFPSPAEEELIDTLTLDEYLMKRPERCFLLKVNGDSMIDAGIMPGDLVIIERGKEPKTGQIVLAQVDGEWTIKYYEKHRGEVALIAANSKYPPIMAKRELRLEGVVVSSFRRY